MLPHPPFPSLPFPYPPNVGLRLLIKTNEQSSSAKHNVIITLLYNILPVYIYFLGFQVVMKHEGEHGRNVITDVFSW